MPELSGIDLSQTYKPEPTGVQEFFSKLQKGYQDSQDKNTMDTLLEGYQKNQGEPNALEDFQIAIEKSSMSPSKRLKAQEFANQLTKNSIEQRKALNKSAEQKQGEFDKNLAKKGAEEVAKIEKELPVLKDTLNNLSDIRTIANKELKGPTSYFKSFFGSESASKVENLSANTLAPIIKTFNPAGTLPTAKLNWIKDTFAVKASDNRSRIEGKVAALEQLTKQAIAREEQRAYLLKKHKGIIPIEEEKQFNEQVAAENQALADELAFKLKLENKKDDETISGLYDAQTGEELTPIPKAEAEELFKQGVITNVPNR